MTRINTSLQARLSRDRVLTTHAQDLLHYLIGVVGVDGCALLDREAACRAINVSATVLDSSLAQLEARDFLFPRGPDRYRIPGVRTR